MHKATIGLMFYEEKKWINRRLRESKMVLNDHYEEVLWRLSDEELKVLSLWLGLTDGRFRSQEEIAEELDVYVGYVYWAQFMILGKMRCATRSVKRKKFFND